MKKGIIVDGHSMKQTKRDLLQGTFDLLVRRTLASGGMHGSGQRAAPPQISQDVLSG
jgi:hypothetical protein